MGASFHLHTHGQDLELVSESPEIGFHARVGLGSIELELYLNLEQWWHFRQLPKSLGYFYASYSPSGDVVLVYDHAEADALAAQFYAERSVKPLQPVSPLSVGDTVTLAPETDGEVIPGGDHVVSSVNDDGSFHVGGNVAVWPSRVVKVVKP